MPRIATFVSAVVIAALSTLGCAKSSTPATPVAVSSELLLPSEPAGAVDVLDAKDQAQDGAPIVVVGRLGGGVNPWVEGRAAFLIVDSRILPSCQADGHCAADCPDCAKEMLSASTMVKFLGEDGKVLPVDARTLLGVKEQETVVIQGVAKRDETGNVSIAGKGVFIRR